MAQYSRMGMRAHDMRITHERGLGIEENEKRAMSSAFYAGRRMTVTRDIFARRSESRREKNNVSMMKLRNPTFDLDQIKSVPMRINRRSNQFFIAVVGSDRSMCACAVKSFQSLTDR